MVQMALSSEVVQELSNMECSMSMQNFSLMEKILFFQFLQNKRECGLSRCHGEKKLNEAERRASMSSDRR